MASRLLWAPRASFKVWCFCVLLLMLRNSSPGDAPARSEKQLLMVTQKRLPEPGLRHAFHSVRNSGSLTKKNVDKVR